MKPDVKDGIVACGVCALGYGLWQIYPPYAWVVVGMVVLGFGVLLNLPRRRK